MSKKFFLGYPDTTRLLSDEDIEKIKLKKQFFKNCVYIGYALSDIPNDKELEILEKEIYSLLKKVYSDYPFNKNPLLLFPYE
ncbi:hypothetical protein BN1013_01444 [Candidatus Rubidus massiliensis]|nr:MAG: hypothetical protein BGO10_04610 [Chlamydia sp. 32-24]CDZ80917.1 hypothetical protein BN1013_01444 [Candidatus Rubidus massiliensis]